MEIFGAVILVAIVLYLLKPMFFGAKEGYAQTPAQPRSASRNSDQAVLDANMGWLRERWQAADAAKESGNLGYFPAWFFDPATERQLARLSKMGVRLSGEVCKGAASDIIGLFEPMEDQHADILKFFKVSLPKTLQNETRARHEATKIFADPEKATEWKQRPADSMQKEFLRYFGIKVPVGLTDADAQKIISETCESKTPEEMSGWNDFESVCDELSDPEALRDYELRKPSLAVIRAAIEEIKKSGGDASDPLEVADKILEMKPELARA